MSTLTPEERYQLETIRLRHAADEDHMESGNSDGREWTFTAIGIHGQRGDLLRIIDRLNGAATRGQDPALAHAFDEALGCQHEDSIESLGEAPGITEQCKDCGAFRRTKIYGAPHPDDGKWTHPPLIRLLLSTMGGPPATPAAPPASPWRRVTGEEPPPGSEVLAQWNHLDWLGVCVARREPDLLRRQWRTTYGDLYVGCDPDWYMPLPPVPTEEDHFREAREMVGK